MRIGIVLPAVPGYSETFFRNKIIGLQQNGVEVLLFVNNPSGTFDLCKVYHAPVLNGSRANVFFTGLAALSKALFFNPARNIRFLKLERKDKRPLFQALKNLMASEFILSKNIDWLHFGFGTMALGKENVAAAIGAKMAVSFRGFDYYVYPLKNKGCYKLLFSKRVKYHVLSEGMKNGLLNQSISEKSIVKITPAIDSLLFRASEKTMQPPIKITTIARLHWIKGLEYTLEAMALLKGTLDFHYTIVGAGVEKERLQFAVYQLGLSDSVMFAGALPPERVKEQLQQTDIYVQYSLQEGFCNAVLEAQAMGLLCVVSDAEGLSENVLDGKTGWVVPKRQPKLLAKKIKAVATLEKHQQETISRQAVERVKNEFNLENQREEFIAFYENKKN